MKVSRLTKLLARYEGLHLIALGCDDAASVAVELETRVDGVHDVVEVQRDVPQVDGGTRLGRFRILHLDDGLFAPAELFYIEHATPDVLWQPALLDQPNGVIGLAAVTVASIDVDATARDLNRIVDVAPVSNDGQAVFQLEAGAVEIADPGMLAARYDDVALPDAPAVAAARLTVKDIAATAALLREAGISTGERADGILWVGPEATAGAIVEFVRA